VNGFLTMLRGGFHKSWAHGVNRKPHPNLGGNAISWAHGVKRKAHPNLGGNEIS
jgi:hypothetical protein